MRGVTVARVRWQCGFCSLFSRLLSKLYTPLNLFISGLFCSRCLRNQPVLFYDCFSRGSPEMAFGTNGLPFTVSESEHDIVFFCVWKSIRKNRSDCPVGVGNRFPTIPLPFTFLFHVGKPDPRGVASKNDLKPVLLGFVIDGDEMRALLNRLLLRIVPIGALNSFVCMTVRGVNDPYAFRRFPCLRRDRRVGFNFSGGPL